MGVVSLGEREIKISWQNAEDKNSGIGADNIYRDDQFIQSVNFKIIEYIDTNIRPSTTYQYKVTAINGSGIEGPE